MRSTQVAALAADTLYECKVWPLLSDYGFISLLMSQLMSLIFTSFA